MYITDSDDDENVIAPYRRFSKDTKLIDDSDDLCQRITSLMKKTRMNSLQRKHLTNSVVDKENVDINANRQVLTPRDKTNPAFKSNEVKKEPVIKHLSFRSSTGNRNANLQMKAPTQGVPYPEELLMIPRVNTFAKKSMSTQEYFPCGTSTDLSKAIMKLAKEEILKSPEQQLPIPGNMKSSMNTQYTPVQSFGNQSTFSMQQSNISKEQGKHKYYKAKCRKYVKKIKTLEQANKELEFKMKFFEDK